jgi:hypothetical protein
MTFTISTVEKTITVEDETLAQLWREWQVTEERSGKERAAWDRIIECATELAELGEDSNDYVVGVDEVIR